MKFNFYLLLFWDVGFFFSEWLRRIVICLALSHIYITSIFFFPLAFYPDFKCSILWCFWQRQWWPVCPRPRPLCCCLWAVESQQTPHTGLLALDCFFTKGEVCFFPCHLPFPMFHFTNLSSFLNSFTSFIVVFFFNFTLFLIASSWMSFQCLKLEFFRILRRSKETLNVFHFPKDKSGTFKLFTKGHIILGFKVLYHWDILSKEWLGLYTSHYLSIRNLSRKTCHIVWPLAFIIQIERMLAHFATEHISILYLHKVNLMDCYAYWWILLCFLKVTKLEFLNVH